MILTAVLSIPRGDAPALWLALIQACWFMTFALAAHVAYLLTTRLDRRLRLAAAAFAAVSLLLLSDHATSWTRQGAAGMSEPLAVALALAAVSAALISCPRLTLALGALVALVRPEAWPLLLAYGAWCWRAEPALRAWIVTAGLAVPALWVAPDVLTSGDAPGGATRARRRDTGMPFEQGAEALTRVISMPPAAVWPLALLAVRWTRRSARGALAPRCRRAQPVGAAALVLALGSAAWILTVTLMAAAGYSGLARYCAPAVALLGALAGAGFAQLLAASKHRAVQAALATAVLLAVALQLPGRATQLSQGFATVAESAQSHDRLRLLAHTVGRERLLRCGTVAISDVSARPALAWQLHVSLARVVTTGAYPPVPSVVVVGPQASARLQRKVRADAELLATRGEWRVYALACSKPADRGFARTAAQRSRYRQQTRLQTILCTPRLSCRRAVAHYAGNRDPCGARETWRAACQGRLAE